MSYVRTTEQIARYESYYKSVVMHEEHLVAFFDTTAEFAREVLPPCFEVPDQPGGVVHIGNGREEFEGVPTDDEEEFGAVFLKAKYKGREGLYTLTAIVSGDMQVSTGREAWGMPKKRGESRLYNNGKLAYAYSERNGSRVIELGMELGSDQGPSESADCLYELKGWIRADGQGLQDAPYLVGLPMSESWNMWRPAALESVRLRLNGSPVDPVHTIPVVRITDAAYRAGVTTFSVDTNDLLADDTDYRPWIYGRNWDDWTDPEARS